MKKKTKKNWNMKRRKLNNKLVEEFETSNTDMYSIGYY